MIVVDASAVIELLLQTALGRVIEARVLNPDERSYAPCLLDIEITSVLRRMVKLKEISASRAQQALDDYLALLIERSEHHELVRRVWALRDSVTAYDGAYIALAEALDAPLLTCDAKLARSHGHRVKIEIFGFS